ncbi:hypothetical protein BDV96DRAFT_566178 [Lophiotrema nucula]|uniref:Uncharacterized protein n=1 Tax=Lophiotrema nucula TaxID=690887 RepID=A0A6A5ZJM0_9PLEO|nr:hypothetical protein BDV96DRAFT_566178 [Lophiotrema nucula]
MPSPSTTRTNTALTILAYILLALQVILCIPILFFALWWCLLSAFAILAGSSGNAGGEADRVVVGMWWNTLLIFLQTFCVSAILAGVVLQLYKQRTTPRTLRYETTKSVLATTAYILLLVNPVLRVIHLEMVGWVPVVLFFYPSLALAWWRNKRETEKTGRGVDGEVCLPDEEAGIPLMGIKF